MAIDSAVALWEYPKIVSGSEALKAPGLAVNSFSTARTTSSAAVRLLGRRQHLQRRGARVGPDHVADRRGGRATVETQRVQKQILGGLRKGGRRRRLGGSTEDDRRVAPSQRVVRVGGWIAQDAGDANEQANRSDLLISVHRIFLAEVNRDFRNSGGSGVFSAAS
jgi:hypothetical protein